MPWWVNIKPDEKSDPDGCYDPKDCDKAIRIDHEAREAHDALVRSADQCAVKKHLENPPSFQVQTKVRAG